jgi:hypothetical protein
VYRGEEKATLVPVNGASNQQPVKTKEKTKSSRDDPFFGMWKDREDMKDPVAWVRKIRRSRIRDL